MLDETETKTGLDAIQIAALRKADAICFFHRHKPDMTGEMSYISATKRNVKSSKNPFEADAVVIIPVDFRLRDYAQGDDKIPYNSNEWNGFEHIGYAQYSQEWLTIASLLRVGDRLILRWERGGFTTEAMQEATPKFYGDRLMLDVERGDKQLSFFVDMRVCENNSARMIRRGATW